MTNDETMRIWKLIWRGTNNKIIQFKIIFYVWGAYHYLELLSTLASIEIFSSFNSFVLMLLSFCRFSLLFSQEERKQPPKYRKKMKTKWYIQKSNEWENAFVSERITHLKYTIRLPFEHLKLNRVSFCQWQPETHSELNSKLIFRRMFILMT